MKTLANVSFVIIAMMVSSFTFAANSIDKQTDKTREAVENAAPDDWETLAKAAQKYIRKDKSMKDAYAWISKSIEIKKTAFNLEVMGDYYFKNKMPRKAMEYYIKSMKKTQEVNRDADNANLQEKLMRAKALKAKVG